MYDEIDIKYSFRAGFWAGFVAGGCIIFGTCLLLGIFVT